MLRQLQLRAPMKAMQLKRSLTYNSKQLQPFGLVEAIKKEQKTKMQIKPNPDCYLSQLMVKIAPSKVLNNNIYNNKNSNNLAMGYSIMRLELPIRDILQNIRQYSVCLNPLEQLQAEQANKMNRSNNLQMGGEQPKCMALVPLDQSQQQMEQNLKNVGSQKPQPQSQQSKLPEQPVRKIPYYNPLRRRSNVDPARVQYIKDRFKERNVETDNNKQQGKKFVSRTTLHSGRLDKID